MLFSDSKEEMFKSRKCLKAILQGFFDVIHWQFQILSCNLKIISMYTLIKDKIKVMKCNATKLIKVRSIELIVES